MGPIKFKDKKIVIKIGAEGKYETETRIDSDYFSIKDGGKAGDPSFTITSGGTGIGAATTGSKADRPADEIDGAPAGKYQDDDYKDKIRLTVRYADLNGSTTGKTSVFTATVSCKAKNQQSVDSVQTIASIPIELENGKGKREPTTSEPDNNKTQPPRPGPNDRINLGRRGVGLGDLQQWKPSTAANRLSLRAGRTGGGTAASGGGNSPIGGGKGGGGAGGGKGGGGGGNGTGGGGAAGGGQKRE